MSAIYKRELKAYFSSPLGYVVLAAFTFFASIFFIYLYANGAADVTSIISSLFIIVIFATPIITMRLLSEERRQKTDQALLTAPVKLWGIVAGKFFAAFTLFAMCFLPTLVFQIIFAANIELNWLTYFGTMLGVLLYGAALVAIGLFISSLTESQVIAAVLSIVASLVVGLMDGFASLFNNSTVSAIVVKISFGGRYEAFANGIIDLSNVVYFVSVTVLFMFLTVRVLEKKRWA